MAKEKDLSPIVEKFEEFFEERYGRKIEELAGRYPERRSLLVDYRDIEKFDPELADELVEHPEDYLEGAHAALSGIPVTKEPGVKFEPHVRIYNLPDYNLLIQDVGAGQIGKLIGVSGIVTKRAEVRPKVKIAVFRCVHCDAIYKIPMDKGEFVPEVCQSCKRRGMKQIDEESYFVDLQRAEMQELLEKLQGGAPASHLELWFEDDIVNSVIPGDTVQITGILRIRPPMKGKGPHFSQYSKFVEVVHVHKVQREFEEIEITKEDEARIKKLSEDPLIFPKIVSSIAPAIYGHDEVKEALALQLFGGAPNKELPDGGKIRSDIHLLLIGDPGAAKCVRGDTKVVLADGSIERIGDIVEAELASKKVEGVEDGVYARSNHDILSLDEDGKVEEEKATIFWKLEAPENIFEIETSSGKRVSTTPEHPFFVLGSDGFVKAKKAEELEKGEFIATPRTLPIKGARQRLPEVRRGKTNASHIRIPEFLTPDFARALGYLTGDGYVRRTASYEISFTNCDNALLDDFREILLSEFGLKTSLKIDKRNGVRSASAFSVELGEILEKMGMLASSQEKKIPREILKSPNGVAREFIRAYFDCEGSVRSKRGDIYAVSYSRELLEEMQILLLRFGIISQLHATHSRATNSPSHEKTEYYRLAISGENVKIFHERIGFGSEAKKDRLQKILSNREFNTNIDVVPNLKNVLKETRLALGLSQFECGITRSTYQHFEKGDRNPSRATLRKIVSAFERKLGAAGASECGRNVLLLRTLVNSDIFWDRVVRVERAKPEEDWVYDLQVEPFHNFIANGMVVHNTRFLQYISDLAPKSIYVSGKSVTGTGLTAAAEKDELGDGGWTLKAGALVLASGGLAAVDEFDKIDEVERGAMHEVMESQSYHPNTKLMLSDGREVKIGELADGLMEKNAARVVRAENCDVLELREDEGAVRLLTTDFRKITPVAATQVSRHSAPEKFVRVKLRTGRELFVTPEHPFWVLGEAEINVVPASELKKGMFVPMPRALRVEAKEKESEEARRFYRLLGYYITDGGYELNRGIKNGINFTNKNQELVSEFAELGEGVFGLKPYMQWREDREIGAARFISKSVVEKMLSLDAHMLDTCATRRIPPKLMGADEQNIAQMLSAAFEGDGCFSKNTVGLVSPNREFVEQVQTLLLRFGVCARIFRDKKVWRLTINGADNLSLFKDKIGFISERKNARLESYLKRKLVYRTNTDIIPNAAPLVFRCLKELKIRQKEAAGFTLWAQKRGFNFTRGLFIRVLCALEEKVGKIKDAAARIETAKTVKELVSIRESLNFSQSDVASGDNRLRHLVSYYERNNSHLERMKELLRACCERKLAVSEKVGKLSWLANSELGWCEVERVEEVENEGVEWVYDVAVLTKAFVSECAILHNSVSVAKAGIVAKFRARTSILAAANPKFGRFDPNKFAADQFDIPPTLLSRFDLIFPIRDVMDEEKDRKLADHMLSSHKLAGLKASERAAKGKAEVVETTPIKKEMLKTYIAYARKSVHPTLTDEATEKIKDFYVELRKMGAAQGAVPITPRQVEGLIRLAEASAKSRLSEKVEIVDAERAIKLTNFVLREVYMDREMKRIDIDIGATGM
ncbi:MAG: LAGLIDADG family homing endonuclease, partial [Candidatus Micrarchaeota archaeon]